MLATSKFLESAARHIAAEARRVEGLVDDEVRGAIQLLYAKAQQLNDRRAAEIAALNPPAPGDGKPTNIGDPNPKGQAKAGKAR